MEGHIIYYSQSQRSVPRIFEDYWKIDFNDWMTTQILLFLTDSILFEYCFRLGGAQWITIGALSSGKPQLTQNIQGFYHARKQTSMSIRFWFE